jgi:hypothetical protein
MMRCILLLDAIMLISVKNLFTWWSEFRLTLSLYVHVNWRSQQLINAVLTVHFKAASGVVRSLLIYTTLHYMTQQRYVYHLHNLLFKLIIRKCACILTDTVHDILQCIHQHDCMLHHNGTVIRCILQLPHTCVRYNQMLGCMATIARE